jgi:hypothetical protein
MLPPLSSTATLVRGTGERIGLGDLRRLGDPHGEIALRDRDLADAHRRAHHDDARALVDHVRAGWSGWTRNCSISVSSAAVWPR